ncbi:hypothetical protein [Pontibacter sp. HSC-36F09]|uniref:hypothetical protein n=1 Tax=Pontibacter sp. HSC-36F09 TaxID=2910966 RepID=UPI00209D9A76|nr:hypothetical protein [Pontibacter sp. HSC-36F09]MCP2045050.1 hypothetical protein [Pontibacter sp. HSC-36F09]
MTKLPHRRAVLLFVPASVDMKQIMRDNGFSQRQINDHLDKYHYFLSTIYKGYLNQYDRNPKGYTRIKDNHLKPFLQGYRDTVKRNLLKWGIIETNNHYIIGKRSKGWRITPKYAGSYRTEICINDTFENNLRNKKAYVNTFKGPVQYLHDMIQRIGIRAEEAHDFVTEKHRKSLQLFHSINANHFIAYNEEAEQWGLYEFNSEHFAAGVEALERSINDKYNADLIAINTIDNGIFNLSLDEYGRLHTPLTNSSRFLRQFLFDKRDPEAPLYNLDLSCSQPFFLNILLTAHYRHNMPESVTRYIEDTSTGTLYSRLMAELGVPAHRRNWFKTEFFGNVFYCSIYTMNLENNLLAQGFKKLYPDVFEFIKNAKRNVYEGKKLVRSYKDLSRQMQQVESDAILNRVVMRAQKQGIWLTTIHDACIVLKEDVQSVYTAMEDVFREEYSLAPTIKVEALRGTKQGTTMLAVVVEEVNTDAMVTMTTDRATTTEATSPEVDTTSCLDSDTTSEDQQRQVDEVIKALPVDKWCPYFSSVYLDTVSNGKSSDQSWKQQTKMQEEDKSMFNSDADYRSSWIAVIKEWKLKEYGDRQAA